MARKSRSKARAARSVADNPLAQSVVESAQQIWLAGLGAFSRARSEGDKMFQVLGDTKKERQSAVLTGGLKIYATKDPKLQKNAENAMNQILPEKPGWTASLVAMDPKTGEVKAMVAGPGGTR